MSQHLLIESRVGRGRNGGDIDDLYQIVSRTEDLLSRGCWLWKRQECSECIVLKIVLVIIVAVEVDHKKPTVMIEIPMWSKLGVSPICLNRVQSVNTRDDGVVASMR